MVLRCGKTGRLFFNQAEATEHAEAFGAAYANFEEVSLEAKVWFCVESGRHADSEAKMNQIKARDPDSKTWEEKTVQYLIDAQKNKAGQKKNRFYDSVDQKKLQVLTEVKQHGRNRAAKALHFTRESGSLDAAEAWLLEHAEDADVDKVDDAFLNEAFENTGDVVMGDGDVVMEEEPDTRQVGDPNPEEVKAAVNQESLKSLIEMGFAEVRSEKALYLRDNNLEHAVAWLGEHGEDADIDLPVKPKPKVIEKPKLSAEEAEAKADAMLKAHRKKKAEEEEISAKDKERMRVESTKMMVEAADRQKEEDRKRAFAQIALEKEAHDRDRLRLKEELRLDYINRFGKEPPAEEEEAAKVKGLKDKPLREQLLHWLGKLKKHKDSNPAGLKTCLNTLKVYGTNLKDNPTEAKFKTLKVENKAFQTRIVPFEEAMEILQVIGFDNKDGVLTQRTSVPDGFLIGEMIKFSDLMLGQL